MRIEAAAYRGKPVFFELIGPWPRPERMRKTSLPVSNRGHPLNSQKPCTILILFTPSRTAVVSFRWLVGPGEDRC
jgi:hypothetical protein